ncbi:MAG: 4Fe-4S binding protein [Acidobacteriota bacterium]|nr:4Fe-4S binding protein [Acidobacteriota bacterium]
MSTTEQPAIERASIDVDIACVGFGPATGGFLTTLSRKLMNDDGTPAIESKVMPGMPLQVICYERADDIGFGVSGVVTRARGIRGSFPELDPAQIPMAAPVLSEKVVYLLDPIGASRRSLALRIGDKFLRSLNRTLKVAHDAVELPYTPEFLHKKDGLVLSIGQFNQWVGTQLMSSGTVQVWPGTPVGEALIDDGKVLGVRLLDQGVDRSGAPETGFTPGMDIRAALTVIGDGPVGAVGRDIDRRIGTPPGNEVREWAVGMKFVIEMRPDIDLAPGTVVHTFGFPEPEIFGFFYVHPGNVASVGIFVPSWFDCPTRTAYRYLQHYIQHPYLWRYLEGGTQRSWGAKSLQESGKRGEPFLAGDGYARIGESSGSTNVLTGSGVDEAWTTGVQLAEGVLELLQAGKPFTRENLAQAYEARRRASWVEKEARVAEKSRDGFQRGVVTGMMGMALTAFSNGRLSLGIHPSKPCEKLATPADFYRGKLMPEEIEAIRRESDMHGSSLHDALMDRCGWPPIPHDGTLLVSHQDVLLMGGKVQAPAGYADHVIFQDIEVCGRCGNRLCVEMCSGQAITRSLEGAPNFDREKCVFCGACMWNCPETVGGQPNLQFKAGAGGLHSAEN